MINGWPAIKPKATRFTMSICVAGRCRNARFGFGNAIEKLEETDSKRSDAMRRNRLE